jgi:protease I
LPGDLKIADVKVEDCDAIVLPGGQINPDLLRVEDDAINVIKGFVEKGKIVAAICHLPSLLIEAGVVKGCEMTSFKSIRTDLKNAGANMVDKDVAISNGIITIRNPDDLDAFVTEIIDDVKDGDHRRKAA